jgi:hypothetical protein
VKKKIMKYTAEQIQIAINEWQVSGLSKKAFCLQRDICPQTFYNWLKRINQPHSSGFAEVTLPPGERTVSCEIIFPSGSRMILQGETSASWLREVLR